MQPPPPTKRSTSASERYSRAIACLMGSTDPLKDLGEPDKGQVLGLIAKLKGADALSHKIEVDRFFRDKASDNTKAFFNKLEEEEYRRELEAAMEGMRAQAGAAVQPDATVPGGTGPK